MSFGLDLLSRPTKAAQATATRRVAFVGQSVFFRACLPPPRFGSYTARFIDFRAGANPSVLREELVRASPAVVVVFRPEIIPPGLLADLEAVRIGYLTEPLPRSWRGQPHPDLRQRLAWLEAVDRRNFDLVVSFDPLIAERANAIIPIWRSLPLPVADDLYGQAQELHANTRVVFLGRPTEWRERWLGPLRKRFPVLHIGHGLEGDLLKTFLRTTAISINVHNNPYPTFENRVAISLAAGQLVISEPLSPNHGLQPGTHLLVVEEPAAMVAAVASVKREPERYQSLVVAGREAAERFRASRLFSELIDAALAESGKHPTRGR